MDASVETAAPRLAKSNSSPELRRPVNYLVPALGGFGLWKLRRLVSTSNSRFALIPLLSVRNAIAYVGTPNSTHFGKLIGCNIFFFLTLP